MTGHDPKLWERTKPILQTDFLVRENIPFWLNNVVGKTVLDAGCGEGYVSRKLRDLGAIVDGFDNDLKMIELAKKAEGGKQHAIRYKLGDLMDVDKLYSTNSFDIIIISGVVCFLDEIQLFECLSKLYTTLKPNGRLLLATNHTDSFFKKAKSNWLEYTSEPKLNEETQKVSLNFNNPEGKKLFTGECYIHTPNRIEKTLNKAGFKIISKFEPLATKEILLQYTSMWGDERKIPYHLIVIAQK